MTQFARLAPAVVLVLAACSAGSSPSASVSCLEPVNGAIDLSAENSTFSTACLALPAGVAVTIHFSNDDGFQHNLSIYGDNSRNPQYFVGEYIGGGTSIDYTIPPLDAGRYYFQCDIHPGMNGSVEVS